MPSSTVPDLGTLRSICQGEKVRLDRRPWYVLSRRVSIAITWVLLHTPVSANQVTWISAGLTLAGPILIAMPSTVLALAGALALVAHYFLDKVDGEIARFRRVFSLTGVYLDELSHTFAYAGTFAGWGIHLAWRETTATSALGILVPAMVGAVAMVMVRQNKSMGALLFAQNVLEQPALLPSSSPAGAPAFLSREAVRQSRRGEGERAAQPWTRRAAGAVRDLVLVVSEYTFVLLLVLIGLAVEAATGDAAFLRLALLGQSLLQTAVLLALIWINHSFNLENECRRLSELALRRAKEGRED